MGWLSFFAPQPPTLPRAKDGIIRHEDIGRFHRSVVLRIFGTFNFIVSICYSGLATWGILDIMLFQASVSDRVVFADMISLLERSLYHSLVAGLAFAVDYVMTQIRDIFEARAEERRQSGQ